jgi:hypothetical protein
MTFGGYANDEQIEHWDRYGAYLRGWHGPSLQETLAGVTVELAGAKPFWSAQHLGISDACRFVDVGRPRRLANDPQR